MFYRNVSRQLSSTSTADPKEISVFNNLSEQWWDEGGEFKPLHSMNKIRIPFIRNGLINSGRLSRDVNSTLLSLSGVKILDVGCGGGILSEPLARIGADVTGLDASQEAIRVAKEHAALEPGLSERLNYIHGTLEDLNSGDYDAVVASEVIEHMTNANQCIALCSKLLKVI
ncbi:hypothetical protein B566_EDAN009286 [Ephemera danica]|nr:hypothetical protein B566_EDAN009286 [Ephemera danica]